ncbi:MAG TPA: SLC13 family permease [Verrucomicrobiales bacterium]|nr:SLC13 family permease [Verrucomicrobiales bacterium]
MSLVLGGILALRLHAFPALLIAAFAVAVLTPGSALVDYAESQTALKRMTPESSAAFLSRNPAERVAAGFGDTCRTVGLLIAFASIVGQALLRSGAAERIVRSLVAFCGTARAYLGLLFSAFLLAIPVYFDTVFYLLVPIARALRRRTGQHYLLYILSIVAGGTMAHSLVPPTPGPLFVAGDLGVSLGTMMISGFIVSLVAAVFGLAFALYVNRRYDLPLRRPASDAEETHAPDSSPAGSQIAALPSLGFSLLPILLPVALIAAAAAIDAFPVLARLPGAPILLLLGDKNFALFLAALIALLLLWKGGPGRSRDAVASEIQTALSSGAVILLITAAGGAFGAVLRETAIANTFAGLAGAGSAWALPVAFLVTALVRTAQGSATVAMITAAPIAHGFLPYIDFHPVYLALAIGCGSKPIPWMNDSGFWIITRMSGMRESETLRFVTPMMSGMGVAGLLATMTGAWLFPLR